MKSSSLVVCLLFVISLCFFSLGIEPAMNWVLEHMGDPGKMFFLRRLLLLSNQLCLRAAAFIFKGDVKFSTYMCTVNHSTTCFF